LLRYNILRAFRVSIAPSLFVPVFHFQSLAPAAWQSAGLAAGDLSPYYKSKRLLRTSSAPIAAALRHCGTGARAEVQNRWRNL
jgi:hypothetical protein